MTDLFLELNCEEIPARMQNKAIADLERLFLDALSQGGFAPKQSRTAISPRHMALEITGLIAQQPDTSEERRGPRIDAPDKAIDGFCAGAGVSRADLIEKDTGKGVFFFAQIEQKGASLEMRLAEMVQDILSQFPWPKSQRWGRSRMSWVRPLHRVNVLLDGKAIAGQVDLGGSMSITFGAETEGHPFYTDEPISLTDFDSYVNDLKRSYVIVDAAERRDLISAQAAEKATSAGLNLRADDGLLAEVTGLVEFPNVLIGKIDDAFMQLPAEVLVTSMRVHQKFFALNESDGKIAPYFMTVANRLPDSETDALIIAGNERVLRARLSDAAFFYETDQQQKLEDYLPNLEQVAFYEGLGTVADKVERLQKLIPLISDSISGCDTQAAQRAAALSKADLVTGMVGEFPELQGLMGSYYALSSGESEAVAVAMRDHYRPAGPSDRLPETREGLALSLADKIDTLVGFFGVGAKPTGSKDPYALRRAALSILRILDEADISLPLDTLFVEAARLHGFDTADADLGRFVTDRLVVRLRDSGLAYDTVAASVVDGDISQIDRQVKRARALDTVLSTETGTALIAGFRRAANILAAEEKKTGSIDAGTVNPALLAADEEKALFTAVEALSQASDETKGGLSKAMQGLADLRGPIDAFFEAIIVNAEDPDLRTNRLALLAEVRGAMMQIADFSKIEK